MEYKLDCVWYASVYARTHIYMDANELSLEEIYLVRVSWGERERRYA